MGERSGHATERTAPDLRVRKGTFPRELHSLGWNRCQLWFIPTNRGQGSDISLVEFDVYWCGFGREKGFFSLHRSGI